MKTGTIHYVSNKEDITAYFQWNVKSFNTVLKLTDPLLPIGASITFDKEEVRITYPTVSKVVKNAPDEVSRALNMKPYVPLNEMNYWLVGKVFPNTKIHDRKYDSKGRLRFLQQSGWTVRYKKYNQETPQLLVLFDYWNNTTLTINMVP